MAAFSSNEERTSIEEVGDAFISQSESKTKNLLSYLDSEITHVRNKSQEPGWTKWAIIGGLATVLWLLFDELEKGIFSIENISALILLLSIAYDGLSFLSELINDDFSTLPNNRFFIANKLGRNRSPFLLMLTRYIAVLILIFAFSQTLGSNTTILAYILNGYYAVTYLIVLILSFLKFPIPSQLKEENRLLKLFSNLIFFIVITYLISQIILLNINLNVVLNVSDIRMAGLVSGIFCLIYLFSKLSGDSPLLNSLVDIRRNLALGRLTISDAIEQVDIALAGLKASDILQQYVSNFLSAIDYVDSEIQLALSEFNAIEKYSSSASISDDQEIIINALHNSVISHVNKAAKAQEKVDASYKPIIWRVELIRSISQVSSNELDDVLKTINVARENLQEKAKSLRKKLEAFLSSI